ncbi:unnamed protein product, partial [Durusdinium trenchii]
LRIDSSACGCILFHFYIFTAPQLGTTSAGWDPEARLARALRAGVLARHWLDNRPLTAANIGGPTLPSKFFIVLK